MKLLKSCKWVDDCVADTPYTPTFELLDHLNCDFYLHGDDPAYNAEGVNICEMFAKAGKF